MFSTKGSFLLNLFAIFGLVFVKSVVGFNIVRRLNDVRGLPLAMSSKPIYVMINGMPGPMAVAAAQSCVDRGMHLVPVGFTGPDINNEFITLQGPKQSFKVKLEKGPGISVKAGDILADIKKRYPDVVLIDYTHPSAVINNVKTYVAAGTDFVMGTTGYNPTEVKEIFEKGENIAVIAPNMAKQIVALQYILSEAAKKFPSSFSGYKLEVR